MSGVYPPVQIPNIAPTMPRTRISPIHLTGVQPFFLIKKYISSVSKSGRRQGRIKSR